MSLEEALTAVPTIRRQAAATEERASRMVLRVRHALVRCGGESCVLGCGVCEKCTCQICDLRTAWISCLSFSATQAS